MQDTIHTSSAAEVFRSLESRPEGLTSSEAETRLRRDGTNTIRDVKGPPLYRRFFANFTHLMALLLWTGGIIAFVAQLPQLGWAIWAVNLINGAFSFWQEYRAEKATEALRQLLPRMARVMRDDVAVTVPAAGLVVGDLMLLSEGDAVSADGRLIEESELRADQSTLTGESHAVRKTCEPFTQPRLARVEWPNVVFAGTQIAAGTGRAIVFATGMNTEFGKIAALTQGVQEELSPLQREMIHATRVVTVIAVGAGGLFFVLAIIMAGVSLAESFIFALGMIVAFVPEGMLPTVTLALAMGVQRMAKQHALTKRLSSVETLGCTTVICTDKTGTLTQNEMTVREIWLPAMRYSVSGVGYAPEGRVSLLDGSPADSHDNGLKMLLTVAGLCNNARLLPPNGESPHWTVLGDPTEAALLVAAAKSGLNLEDKARRASLLREIPFDSRRKRMTTIHVSTPEDCGAVFSRHSRRVAFVKGAPKEILALCESVFREGCAQPLSDVARTDFIASNDGFARDGLRVLAMAIRPLPDDLQEISAETVERELTLLGMVAMMDPPRPEVTKAVETCRRAGIRVIMITGDYGLTAESIAQRIGIVQPNHARIITGADLDQLSDKDLHVALQEEVIFARVAPEHKLRVVASLQSAGQVVAVTGDGVNDAPALKKADIGVAMGMAGTDVAREAADIILTDDNFASIVKAIEEGRAVYANIKKFVTYIFTSNMPEAAPFIAFVLSHALIPLALNIMQILSIDLGTDMVPALALGAESPEPGLMDRPPRNLRQHVITWSLLARAYLFLGLIQSVAAMSAFYFMYWTNGYWGQWLGLPSAGHLYEAATAMALGAVVATQIGNVFAQRTERVAVFQIGLFSNRLVWVGIATELAIVLAIIYLPMLQAIFGTYAFAAQYWLFLLAWTPSLLLADELRKAIVRRMESRGSG